MDVKTPFYIEPESVLVKRAGNVYMEKLAMDRGACRSGVTNGERSRLQPVCNWRRRNSEQKAA
jgi:hypothetical protein